MFSRQKAIFCSISLEFHDSTKYHVSPFWIMSVIPYKLLHIVIHHDNIASTNTNPKPSLSPSFAITLGHTNISAVAKYFGKYLCITGQVKITLLCNFNCSDCLHNSSSNGHHHIINNFTVEYFLMIAGIASIRYFTHFFSASLPTNNSSGQFTLYFFFIDSS
ncbi:MAG: hypothetical protein WCG25_07785 [bacterium]